MIDVVFECGRAGLLILLRPILLQETAQLQKLLTRERLFDLNFTNAASLIAHSLTVVHHLI